MTNQQLAQIFYQIAELLEMQEVAFKPRAYEKVARILESMSMDVSEVYKSGGLKALEEIPSVGIGIAEKMEEFIKTGHVKEYEKLKKTCPVKLNELTAIEGLGPKMIKVLYKKLKIKNLKDLEKAARAGKISKLPRFGVKTEENILRSIEFAKKGAGRLPLGYVLPIVREIENRFKELPFIKKVVVAGSIRRRKETVGDVDLLVVSNQPAKAMIFFVNLPEVERIYAQGATKSSVRLNMGLDADLRVVEMKSFGSALQYFTGNKDHNIALRKIAISQNFKLNEYGLFKMEDKKEIYLFGQDEEAIYQRLGLAYIEPELRENGGEIEAAQIGKLPSLVGYNEIKGDLHVHSNWSDGTYTIEEMAREAIKTGYAYMALTDHTRRLRIAGGLSEKELLKQGQEIDHLNEKLKNDGVNFTILKGAEVDINPDGTLDLSDKALSRLDVVLASVHSAFKISEKAMTERICRAMRNPYVSIVAHLTGRLIGQRDAYQLDLDRVFAVAEETKTCLEINAFPERLDLSDTNIKKAVAAGVKLVISTDSHATAHLCYMELGIAQARRGWAGKSDIINNLPLPLFLKAIKNVSADKNI